MTITVDVRPEVEAELARRASVRGRPIEAYVATLLEEVLHLPPAHQQQEHAARPKGQRQPGRKSLAQLFAESPFKGLDLDFERDPDLGRDVEL
jgi:hypothetical protein